MSFFSGFALALSLLLSSMLIILTIKGQSTMLLFIFMLPPFLILIFTSAVLLLQRKLLNFRHKQRAALYKVRRYVLNHVYNLRVWIVAQHREEIRLEPYRAELIARTGDRCPICLESFEANEDLQILPSCLHTFHEQCLQGWLDVGDQTCPTCRQRVFLVNHSFVQENAAEYLAEAERLLEGVDDLLDRCYPMHNIDRILGLLNPIVSLVHGLGAFFNSLSRNE